jgi:hypothetical protein
MFSNVRPLRAALAGLALAALAGVAAAKDYVVVASSEPAIPRGLALDAGARLALPAGRTVTLMHASGDLLTLRGAAGGVVAPVRKAASADSARLEVLRVIVTPSTREVAAGQSQRRSRSICPAPETLTTLDGIAEVQAAGCTAAAATALDAWIAAHPPAEE